MKKEVHRHHITTDGAWCWFQDPRAVRYVDERDRTYVGWITRMGDIQIQQIDHETGETARSTLHAEFEADDHNAPSILIDPDGHLLVFYTAHGGPDIRYRRSVEPESVQRFHPERSVAPSTAHTYPNPYQLDGEDGRVYLFYRNARKNLALITSDDNCATWSDEEEIVETEGWNGIADGWVYFKIDSNAQDRIDIATTHYDYAQVSSPYRDIRHFAIKDGQFVEASGSPLDKPDGQSLRFTDCPVVYDASETAYFSWIWDCATIDNQPALAYAELRPDDEHRYRYARWTGTEWIDTEVTNGGHNIRPQRVGAYSGGIYLDREEPGTCLVSVGDHSSSRIERWYTPDNGLTWEVTELSDGHAQNIRPIVPRNRHRDLAALWMRGNYEFYARQEFDTSIVSGGRPRGDTDKSGEGGNHDEGNARAR